ncbi:hypothetical protein LXT21_21985 [Myxococcus sp. K38C18041901]|uniref:hypothetical protein n=1 Tax=Myxococcus guangdongensis TaxID=2906760 RepID=UPI0020A7CB5C|nr:hypothetical protein [Myxococcus guangdongensis]MCP3061458.1 hypothetical protein [Myxococcus guangdongensis]
MDALRPSVMMSQLPFPYPKEGEFTRFREARMHLDCLERWEDRVHFSRACYDLAQVGTRGITRLRLMEGGDWLIHPYFCRRQKTFFVVMQLADWPIHRRYPWGTWPEELIHDTWQDFEGEAGVTLKRVIAEVLHRAPDLKALEEIQREVARRFVVDGCYQVARDLRNDERYPFLTALSEDEQHILDEYLALRLARGRAHSVELLLVSWMRFSATIGSTRCIPEEFAEYLYRRDALEEAVQELPSPLAKKLETVLSEADEQYRSATIDDGGRTFNKSGLVDADWWWRRRPTSGPLSDMIDKRLRHQEAPEEQE